MLGVSSREFFGYTVSPALRLSAAVLISAMAVVPAYWLAILLFGDWHGGGSLFALLMVALMLTLGSVAIVGLPIHFLLAALKLSGLWAYALAGFAVPCVFMLIERPLGDSVELGLAGQAVFAGGFGILVAAVFWKVAISPR